MLSHRQILEALDTRGVKGADAAGAAGLTPDQFSKIRTGIRKLTLEEATLLCDAYALDAPDPPLIRVTAMPADTNPYGGVFGGWLMGQMGLACGSFASRHSGGKAVVVAADNLTFTGAMRVGDELSVYVDLKRQGRTSLLLSARAMARERDGSHEFEVATGEFTFVALDENDRPREIPNA